MHEIGAKVGVKCLSRIMALPTGLKLVMKCSQCNAGCNVFGAASGSQGSWSFSPMNLRPNLPVGICTRQIKSHAVGQKVRYFRSSTAFQKSNLAALLLPFTSTEARLSRH